MSKALNTNKVTHSHPSSFTDWRVGVGISIIIGFIVLAFWLYPTWQASNYRNSLSIEMRQNLTAQEIIQFEKNASDIENASRVALAQIVGGSLLLVGLFFTYQSVSTARQTLRATEEGKLTERFSKSIEMLGDARLQVRLGGIYALERIAKDSSKDHWTVMEVLSAFLREAAFSEPVNPNRSKVPKFVRAQSDIQAAITVIGRRSWIEQELLPLDLKGVDLEGCNLFRASLDRADLSQANLKNTFLGYASLNGAILRGANLREAYLIGTNLNHADLVDADLRVQEFFAINMYGALIPDLYPEDVVGDLKLKTICLGIDHHKEPRFTTLQFKDWHNRFRERQEEIRVEHAP